MPKSNRILNRWREQTNRRFSLRPESPFDDRIPRSRMRPDITGYRFELHAATETFIHRNDRALRKVTEVLGR
ncbi:hypothetical protein NPIL_381141 [Nephila pilipes]|uniref:Uncharacterized protein n=1 Tax=Nephila pilipes TaxID=299642 RepID=A0A8X6Q9J4_NEPPI|nr:hypothetical protein NPIL_381141 [Nephila pilipes]